MNTVFFWNGSEVIPTGRWGTHNGPQDEHRNLLCLDVKGWDGGEYGIWAEKGWKSVPIDAVPKEFRMHLLLLGVS